jgi:hypothetical protein
MLKIMYRDERSPWGHFSAFRLVIYNIRAVLLKIPIAHFTLPNEGKISMASTKNVEAV